MLLNNGLHALGLVSQRTVPASMSDEDLIRSTQYPCAFWSLLVGGWPCCHRCSYPVMGLCNSWKMA